MEDGANSTLSIAKVGKLDSGNYTCSIGPNDFYTITVHILHGKSVVIFFFSNFTHPCFRCFETLFLLAILSQALFIFQHLHEICYFILFQSRCKILYFNSLNIFYFAGSLLSSAQFFFFSFSFETASLFTK